MYDMLLHQHDNQKKQKTEEETKFKKITVLPVGAFFMINKVEKTDKKTKEPIPLYKKFLGEY